MIPRSAMALRFPQALQRGGDREKQLNPPLPPTLAGLAEKQMETFIAGVESFTSSRWQSRWR
jgi:hypothetical protein